MASLATSTGMNLPAACRPDMQAGEPWTEATLSLFHRWQEEARIANGLNATAMVLATATAEGIPSARMVLLKSCEQRGFVFYTNLGSRKAGELRENPQAALFFDWPEVGKYVHVQGCIEPVASAEADAYFATRPALSRIGAWASRQSQSLDHRWHLWLRIGCFAPKWIAGRMTRPPYWSGFRLVPSEIVFETTVERIGQFQLYAE